MPTTLTAKQMTQINVRIDSQLKAEGDSALAAAGITPTQAVRAVWTIAAKNAGTPKKLHATLFPTEAKTALLTKDEIKQKNAKIIEEGASICEQAYKKMGLKHPYKTSQFSFKELKEAAYLESIETF